MAIYRSVQLSFWTDNKVVDDFTPEDKYFYLYLFTNPQTNLCGCYEVSLSTMAIQLGYNKETVERLLVRFENVHNLIRYSKETKEVLILNWNKYNWQGGKQKSCLLKEISFVKNVDFKGFLESAYTMKFDENNAPCKGLAYPLQASVTVTVNNNNINTLKDNNKNNKDIKKKNKDIYIYYPNDEKLNQAFNDFVDMRKKIKAPMTERAITLAMNKLETLSGGDNDLAIEILNQSIMNSWKGLFEIKEKYAKKSNSINEWMDA